MADIMKVSSEEMQAAMQSFKTQQTELKVAYLSMSDAIRKLDGVYEGEAAQALRAQFSDMYKNLEKTEVGVNRAIQNVQDTLLSVEERESAVSNLLEQLEELSNPFNS